MFAPSINVHQVNKLLTVVAILTISFGLLHFITNTQFIEYAMASNDTNETKNNNTVPISSIEKENVEKFIQDYFLLFDKKVDVNDLLKIYSDTGFKLVYFPDVTIDNKEELVEWYENLVNTYANISHTVQTIDTTKNHNGSFNVNVTVRAVLQPTNGSTIDENFFDTFRITPSENNNYLVDYATAKIIED